MLNNSRTRADKAKAQEEYTAVDREVKRSIKKDKRDYIDDLARQAETAAGQENLRDLYLVSKKLTGKFQHRQASDGKEREPTDNNQGAAETMGRTLYGTAEPPHL